MSIDTLSIARSGTQAATTRLGNRAHNVANTLSGEFRNLRTEQRTGVGGGVQTHTRTDREPKGVDLAGERVQQSLAESELKANLRTIEADLEIRGSLLDLFA